MTAKDSNVLNRRIKRRSFLKGSAATAAVVGVGAAFPGSMLTTMKPEEARAAKDPKSNEEKIYLGICRGNCGGACPMNVHVRNGKIVKTSVFEDEEPDNNRLCQRGLTHAQRVYSPDRAKYPLRRVGERGEGKWERITWDEAIDTICTKWKGYVKKYGGSSIGNWYDTGAYTMEGYYYKRLFMSLGSTNIDGGYDMNGLQAGWNMLGFGLLSNGNHPADYINSKYIFVWGANATITQQSTWIYYQRAIDNGAKLIVIDPNFTLTASKADKWVPIRPGTDGALAMAMINIIIAEGKQDNEWLIKGSVAPFLVKNSDGKFLRLSDLGQAKVGTPEDAIVVLSEDGKIGLPDDISTPVIRGTYTIKGIKVTTAYDLLLERIAEWTPDKAAELCDIPVDTIYELAHMYVKGPSLLNLGFGLDHIGNGVSTYQAIYTLVVVAGQLGKPGATIGGHIGGASRGMHIDIAGMIMTPQLMNKFMDPSFVPSLDMKAMKIGDVLDTGKYRDRPLTLKSLYIHYGNPVVCQPDRKALLKAFSKMDFIVVADNMMTETAQYADIFLPTPHWFEFTSSCASVRDFCTISEQAIPPSYECKPDIEIANLLGKGMGMSDIMNLDEDAYFTLLYDNPLAKSAGISWELLKEKKNIRAIPTDYIYPKDYKIENNPTGRAEFYMEKITSVPAETYAPFDERKYALPLWEPPIEAWHENPLYKKYPLQLMSHRHKFKTHSQFSNMPWLLELQSEPMLYINPVDAKARGVKQGDYVKVYNDRGYVVIKASLHSGMRPGVVDTEHTWPKEFYKEGHYSDLTNKATIGWVEAPVYFDTLVEVEKA